MTDVEEVPAALNVTLQIPMDQLLRAYTERPGPYRGGDDDEGPPPIVLDMIGERAAQILANEQRAEVRKMARERLRSAVEAQITAAVQETLASPIQRTDEFGAKRGEPTTLHALVMDETKKWLTKETGDYNRRQTMLQKYVGAEVDKAIKADLDEALKQARAEVTARLKAQAAAAIADTIQRVGRGLA